jgi:hypothetical protein
VVRDGPEAEPSHVVVLGTLGTKRRSRLKRRRSRPAEPEPEPAPVATTRATIIDVGSAFEDDEDAARAWLDRGVADAGAEAERALVVLNRVLHAHRTAAADPYARDVGAEQALVARLGFGAGEQVADGRWTAALELDLEPRRPRRIAALRPQERLAALLGGRDRALACEELTLRARLDLDEGRPRVAALQLRVALEAALTELEDVPGEEGMAPRLAELRDARGDVGRAANDALTGDLDAAAVERVDEVVGRIEAALRARSARGVG